MDGNNHPGFVCTNLEEEDDLDDEEDLDDDQDDRPPPQLLRPIIF